MRFQVESTLIARGVGYVLARHIAGNEGRVTNKSKLGGVRVEEWIDQPRKLKDDGSLDVEVFSFALRTVEDLKRFQIGQIVELDSE